MWDKKLLYIYVALILLKKVLVCLKLIKFGKEQKDEKAQLSLILIITTSDTIEELSIMSALYHGFQKLWVESDTVFKSCE